MRVQRPQILHPIKTFIALSIHGSQFENDYPVQNDKRLIFPHGQNNTLARQIATEKLSSRIENHDENHWNEIK